MSPRTMSVSPSPSGGLLPTVAQQLYASSLATASPPPSRRPSVSSTHASSNSDPDETSTAGASSSSPPKPSAFRRHTHGRQAKKNSSATSSPSLSPASANILLDSHDPRHFFDCTRLSGGTRRLIHEGPTQQGVSVAASTAFPSSLSPYTPHHSLSSVSVSSPSENDRSSNENLLLNPGKLAVSSDSISRVSQFSKEAQALYHPAIFSKPVTASSASASVVHRNRRSICFPVSSNSSTQDESKRVQSISSVDQCSSDTLRLYSAITEDEKLRAIPNPSSGSLLPIQITEDQPIIQTTTYRRESQFPPTINVLDVQNSSSPSCIRIQTKLARRNTYSPDDKRLYHDTSSLPTAESLVLRQPRPIRPLIAIPARFNLQLEAAEQGPSANEDQMKEMGTTTTRSSSVLRRLSAFGMPRTRDPQKSLSTILDPS